MLFDYLVTGQVLPMNPAYAVRGPKHVVRTGRPPVQSAEETRILLDHIDINTIAGLRDRALIGAMVYSFARVGAVVGMNVEDYYQAGKRWWFRLREKGRSSTRGTRRLASATRRTSTKAPCGRSPSR
jgi:integrase/recombinase XerD